MFIIYLLCFFKSALYYNCTNWNNIKTAVIFDSAFPNVYLYFKDSVFHTNLIILN